MKSRKRCIIIFAVVFTVIPQTHDVLNDLPDINIQTFNAHADLIFGNYSYDSAWTNYPWCQPSVYIGVHDSDEVDTVWFRYKRANESNWQNKSMDPMQGTWIATHMGFFRVNVSQTETWFDIQFFANDTTGNLYESSIYPLKISYSRPHPYEETLPWFLIIPALFFGLFSAYLLWLKFKPSLNPSIANYVENHYFGVMNL